MATDKRNKGEGDPEAARHYNEATQEYVKSGKVEEHEQDITNISDAERKEMEEAEKAGAERAKEHDHAVDRDYSKPK